MVQITFNEVYDEEHPKKPNLPTWITYSSYLLCMVTSQGNDLTNSLTPYPARYVRSQLPFSGNFPSFQLLGLVLLLLHFILVVDQKKKKTWKEKNMLNPVLVLGLVKWWFCFFGVPCDKKTEYISCRFIFLSCLGPWKLECSLKFIFSLAQFDCLA